MNAEHGRYLRISKAIDYKDGYALDCVRDQQDRSFYQVVCIRPDVITGQAGTGRGGRAYLNGAMTDDGSWWLLRKAER